MKDPEEIGLYDSATGDTLYIQKRKRFTNPMHDFILDYTKAVRGPIVKITIPYTREQDWGSSVHFFVNELAREVDAREGDNPLRSLAKLLGMRTLQLVAVIREHAP